MSVAEDDLLYLCASDVATACERLDTVDLMRDVLRLHANGGTILPDEAYLAWTTPGGERVRSLNMPGYVDGAFRTAGAKIINANPLNPTRGLPRASGVTLVFDDTTARICCIMEGAHISSLRTASVTAVAVEALQGDPIEIVAVIGAGVQARAHLALLGRVLPHCRSIRLFDIERARAAALRDAIAPTLEVRHIRLELMDSAEDAIRPAQLIIPVTTVTEGYIPYHWLRPGALLVNVSLDDPLPEVVLRADRLFVDDWGLVRGDSRRLLGRLWRQALLAGPNEEANGRRLVTAELGDVLVGRAQGRVHAEDIIVVNPFGLAIEDLTLAGAVYRWAVTHGVGQRLER